MGVLCIIALNFGGGAGDKSSTGGIVTASSGVSIRQCWRMLLRFVVHNLWNISLQTLYALTECLVPQLVILLLRFPLSKRRCGFANKKIRNKDTDFFG